MHILGISCYYHDSAAVLLSDGRLAAAAQEERFSRIKTDESFPSRSIAFCLARAGIEARDLDCVVFYEKPLVKFERILTSSLATFPRSRKSFTEAMVNWFDQKLWIKSRIQKELGIEPSKIMFVDHHLAHAASALFASPFEGGDTALLTLDGVGEWTTAASGVGRNSRTQGDGSWIRLDREHRFPHSIGLLYSAFTAFLGFQVNEGEYKVMGMAPYGEPRYRDAILDRIVRVHGDGSFTLDMDYFEYHRSAEKSFGRKLVDLLGEPRNPEAPFVTTMTDPGRVSPSDPGVASSQKYADIAASIQKVTEEIILGLARQLRKDTGARNLCMAGGVALNSVANGIVQREAGYDEVFIQPAAGDAGGALGAALYAWQVIFGRPGAFLMEHAYWGEEYGDAETVSALRESGLPFETMSEDALLDRTVDAMIAGSVVGFHQDRFEWGPRALGNRSIFADPRDSAMKDIINRKIKFREPFRPFAPAVAEEDAAVYFEGFDQSKLNYPARFMLTVHPWRQEYADLAPAVNHMGTGRLQTVRREWNPRYHEVIRRFGQATGARVVVNTSFNLRGEPIVSSPSDALRTFMASGIDNLAMGSCWVSK